MVIKMVEWSYANINYIVYSKCKNLYLQVTMVTGNYSTMKSMISHNLFFIHANKFRRKKLLTRKFTNKLDPINAMDKIYQ